MAGDRQQIDAELVDVGGNLADGLRRIGVEQDFALAGDAGAILPIGWIVPPRPPHA